MRLSQDEAKVFSNVARQFPEFVRTLSRLRMDELEALPMASKDSRDVLCGRVQALTELQRMFEPR